MYFDAHAHLQNLPHLVEVLDRAEKYNVRHIICNAIYEKDWEKLHKINKEHPNVYIAIGIHPMAVSQLKMGWEDRLETMLKQQPNFMVGEIGLDKQYDTMPQQIKVFQKQLTLACKYNRPAILHCFRAWPELLSILNDQAPHLPPKMMSHSHHGNAEIIPELIQKYNMYFSYSSICVPETHPKIQSCLKSTPLERILVESDCPDLAQDPTAVIDIIPHMIRICGQKKSTFQKMLFKNAQHFVHQ